MLFLIIFCVIQGFSEFLPISSQGHLIIFNHFANLDDFTELSILELNIIAHAGSLFAVFLYYNNLLLKMVKGLRVFYRPDLDMNLTLLFKIVVSTIPIVVLGYLFGKNFNYDNHLFNFNYWNNRSILFGTIFILSQTNIGLTVNNQEGLDFKLALLAGLFQCLALIPGVSRAGANIIVLRLMGFNRNFTVRYSNILSIPVIFNLH